MRHLSNAVRVPKDDANLRRGQTLPGELAHVLGDLTRVDLQPRRRRPPVRQSRLRDTLPVSRKASRRAKPEAHRLTSNTQRHARFPSTQGESRAAKSKASKPAGRAAASDVAAGRRSALRNAPLAVHAPHDCESSGFRSSGLRDARAEGGLLADGIFGDRHIRAQKQPSRPRNLKGSPPHPPRAG